MQQNNNTTTSIICFLLVLFRLKREGAIKERYYTMFKSVYEVMCVVQHTQRNHLVASILLCITLRTELQICFVLYPTQYIM